MQNQRNQRVKPGNVKKGALAESLARKGEEGECLFKVNAESTGKARKCEEGGAC
ncbi:hypothetical protein CRG98_006531 [Punica granatum]|uniref:Uncharacterized protein n=1 Tax=Punica granatum TaxID=22663 RepID=A0A2I0KYZ6_PUNGR|nr:hypothetical protein CRG98_006531 [Punica granatum]